MNLLRRFNVWYDGLAEPYRFLFFAGVLMGWLPCMFFEALFPVGIIWLLCSASLALTRL